MLLSIPGPYTGRYLDRARDILARGEGVMYIATRDSNYVHCDRCPSLFVPPPLPRCECCRPAAGHNITAEYKYELAFVSKEAAALGLDATPIFFCRKHLATFEGFAGVVVEEKHNDVWGACPQCKMALIVEWM